jgi:type II secretory pathway component PulF
MNIELEWARLNFTQSKKTRVFRQLQRLIGAGIPIRKSLDMLYQLYSRNGKKPSEPMAVAVQDWRQKLAAGKKLSECLTGWVSSTEQMIIEAGEQSDQLSGAFSDALLATSAGKKIKWAIIGGVLYPGFMLVALVAMIYGFSTTIVPTFATIVDPAEWTGNAAKMYKVSEFTTNYLIYIVVSLVAFFTFVTATMPYLKGDIRTYLDKIPPWSLYKVITGASFMISMRGFLVSGVTVPDALRKIKANAKPYLKSRTDKIYKGVNMGSNLGVAMQKAGQNFPDTEIMGEISIYAELEGFAENLDVLAKEWIEGATEKTKAVSKIMSTLMMVLLTITIGFIASSIFELQDIIAKSVQS